MSYNPYENNDSQGFENNERFELKNSVPSENSYESINQYPVKQTEEDTEDSSRAFQDAIDESDTVQEEVAPQYAESSAYTNVYQPTPVAVEDNNAYGNNQSRPTMYSWYGRASDNSPFIHSIGKETPASADKKSKQKRIPLALIILICMLVSVVFGSGSAILVNHFFTDKESTDEPILNTIDEADFALNTQILTNELSTTEIVDKYADSVVEIITEYVETGVFSQQFIKSGAGSGVIIDSDGYIVTNHHVIENARRISITLRDGTILSAELIGSDAKMDLALLKVDDAKLSSAVLGNSDSLKVGQRTIAIGNPLGQLGGTVTEGIISALDRNVTVDGQTMNLMQTDTAINPGNSGGGLFDGKGNLIGIVVAKSSGSEVEGLGFAIPINDAVEVISDLKAYGYVRGRVSIGMEFLDVDSEPVAWMYGLDSLGCYVYSVDNNSNAKDAGFASGDLILEVDGEAVESSENIEVLLEGKKVGDVVEFTIRRGRNKGTLSLKLEEYNPNKTSLEEYSFQW